MEWSPCSWFLPRIKTPTIWNKLQMKTAYKASALFVKQSNNHICKRVCVCLVFISFKLIKITFELHELFEILTNRYY